MALARHGHGYVRGSDWFEYSLTLLQTVDTRIGLFSRASRPPNPLSIAQKQINPDTGEVHGHLPHRIWLKFIENRFSVVRHNNPTQLGIHVSCIKRVSRSRERRFIDAKRNNYRHAAQSRCRPTRTEHTAFQLRRSLPAPSIVSEDHPIWCVRDSLWGASPWAAVRLHCYMVLLWSHVVPLRQCERWWRY